MKTENAFLKHNNEDVLQLDMKNDSFESSLVSPCLFFFLKPFVQNYANYFKQTSG